VSEAQCGRLDGSSSLLLPCRSWYLDVGQGFFVNLVIEHVSLAFVKLFLAGEEQAWLDGAASERAFSSESGLASE
jgi:hypothetical protein